MYNRHRELTWEFNVIALTDDVTFTMVIFLKNVMFVRFRKRYFVYCISGGKVLMNNPTPGENLEQENVVSANIVEGPLVMPSAREIEEADTTNTETIVKPEGDNFWQGTPVEKNKEESLVPVEVASSSMENVQTTPNVLNSSTPNRPNPTQMEHMAGTLIGHIDDRLKGTSEAAFFTDQLNRLQAINGERSSV